MIVYEGDEFFHNVILEILKEFVFEVGHTDNVIIDLQKWLHVNNINIKVTYPTFNIGKQQVCYEIPDSLEERMELILRFC